MGFSVGTIMTLMGFVNFPWLIKPLWGFLSDNVSLFGYKRKSYLILSSTFSICTALLLGLSPVLPLAILFSFMLLDSLGGAVKDVVVDGLMVEEGQKYKITGTLQSVQWGSLTLATVLTGVLGGIISEKADYRLAYLSIVIFPLMIGILSLLYKEPKAQKVEREAIWPKYKGVLKNGSLWFSALFLFCLWFSPAIGTPILSKMRDELHMSKIWIGWLSTIGSAASIFGAVTYWKVNQKINLKRWLYITTVVSAVSTFAYLYLTPHTALIYSIVFGISGMFMQLLILDFVARICPKGTEATTFALLCSVLNLGSLASNLAGGWLFDKVGYNGLVSISGLFTLFCLLFIPYLKIERKENVIQT
jgi:MFS family permease